MNKKMKLLNKIYILKRNKKKIKFDCEKIAIAIKKGFDSVNNSKYTKKDINKIFVLVLKKLQNINFKKKITIEKIQNIIEQKLKKLNYIDIYKSFKSYRERRNKSRKIFISKQHKLLKAIEKINQKEAKEENLKRENANIDGNCPMGMMLQFGSTISREFAKAYQIKKKFYKAHESGKIHIHDMDFYPMGTTTCTQINLKKLYKKGFSTGHGFLRPPNSIQSYAALAAIVLQANQNDQHGGQSIPAFDYYMAPGIIKTFKKIFKRKLYDFYEIKNLIKYIKFKKIILFINKLKKINFNLKKINIFFKKKKKKFNKITKIAYKKTLKETEKTTYQAMESFIHNLNTMHSRAGAQVPFTTINFGTDTSYEGRMIIKNFLNNLKYGLGKKETAIFPISIFKIKKGKNYYKKDKNYDLLQLAIKVSSKRLYPNFSFLDASFNKNKIKKNKISTEIAYMGCRTRVIDDINDKKNEIVTDRGNLSFTTINLVRLGIKNGIYYNNKPKIKNFFKNLKKTMILTKNQLLERFNLQCKKTSKNFNFLFGQKIWKNSKKIENKNNSFEALKHGTLSIGFIGLAECLIALTGKHHGENKKAKKLGIKIIKYMRNIVNKFTKKNKLNFSLLATPAEGLSGRFVNIDYSIFGKIKNITDKDYYTNSFHIPVYYKTSIKKKIEIESDYHKLTNGGHITYVEVDGDISKNIKAFKEIIYLMSKNNIGYGAINHPVDRDPICGYTGIINNTCPSCKRNDSKSKIKFERIRRITGYLVGTLDRFNNAKRAEEKERIKHNKIK